MAKLKVGGSVGTPKDEGHYEGRADARSLIEAHSIISDKKRHDRAKKHLADLHKEHQDNADAAKAAMAKGAMGIQGGGGGITKTEQIKAVPTLKTNMGSAC